ncbi:MAG: sigma-70 family RNA polymerase sigma factor [Vicinamibacteria bacterium]|nr:sigma-70 family RNA polymerase sigma factor [Vicinamibacteria bacterium]
MNSPSDSELVAQVAAGNAGGLAELFDRHAGRMKSLALRIVRTPEEAEDVVQEIFVQAWRQAGRFDSVRGTVLAWLSIMVRSRSLDHWRRRSTRRETGVSDAHELESPRTPGNDPRAWAAKSGLSDLPADLREPLELAYWEGFSQSEIADRLGLPLGTVKTRMRTGLKRLRKVLE